MGTVCPNGVSKKIVGRRKAKYWHIIAAALAEPSLSVIATPNPSTLLKLMELIRQLYAELVEALSCRGGQADIPVPPVTGHRRAYLKTGVGRESGLTFSALWPDLRAVITWTGGNCGALIPKLKPLLPETTALIEMGYLSSECLGSLNVDVVNNHCVPTFCDNLFEFVSLAEWETADPQTLLLDQVEVGEKYQLLVTTPAGLYRYAMNDIVEVTGRFNRTPTIRFVQKGKGVTNITGEKLYEHHVTTAVDAVLARLGVNSEFYVMVAEVETQQYTLYVEHASLPAPVAEEVDKALAEVNVEFQSKRESGRLKPVVVRCVRPDTGDSYRTHCINKGQRESQFKLVRLQYRHECGFNFSNFIH
jgi:hypothetical protein